jgi:hypothetical protein
MLDMVLALKYYKKKKKKNQKPRLLLPGKQGKRVAPLEILIYINLIVRVVFDFPEFLAVMS